MIHSDEIESMETNGHVLKEMGIVALSDLPVEKLTQPRKQQNWT